MRSRSAIPAVVSTLFALSLLAAPAAGAARPLDHLNHVIVIYQEAWRYAAGLAMSYYDATNLPEGVLARQYTLLDHFFHPAFGGSFLNHQWLICACTPAWPNAPADIVIQLDANGIMTKDGQVTPD